MNNDQLFKDRARVLDENLSSRVSTAGADTLLAQIVSMERELARRRLRAPRRALLGMAAVAALAGAIVVGPSLFGASKQVYASQAVTIDRVDDQYAFYFTQGDPDPAELEKAFRKVGLDNLTVMLFPVSPRMPAGSVFGFEKSDPDAIATFAGDSCPERAENCITAFRVTADIKGPAEVRLGRPAKPGEKYDFPADASWPGEALAGVNLRGRSTAEAAGVVREHHLKVAYGLDWPLPNDEKGVRFEADVPASRIDPSWQVATADSYNDGVIVLHVVPGPDATPPPEF
ncbi:hypothetical protein ACU635_59795 [[Actinomadura] parvosata]|uniref:hypothetical protein n=1 Tax=[Actinomadura] parvosata TaxID=1955412 RepID=UPI00406CD325